MSLAADIQEKTDEAARPRVCKIGHLLVSLETEDSNALRAAISSVREDRTKKQCDRIFSIQWLTDVLTNNGHFVGKTVVSEHIRESCACDIS